MGKGRGNLSVRYRDQERDLRQSPQLNTEQGRRPQPRDRLRFQRQRWAWRTRQRGTRGVGGRCRRNEKHHRGTQGLRDLKQRPSPEPQPGRDGGTDRREVPESPRCLHPLGPGAAGVPRSLPPMPVPGTEAHTGTRVGRQGREERGAAAAASQDLACGPAQGLLFTQAWRGRGFLPEEAGPRQRGQEGAGTGQRGAPP